MFSVTGPVTTMPSACRGEATNWMPNRPRSKTTVPRTFRSASAALPPPALDLAELERAAEEPAHLLLQGLRQLQLLPAPEDQVLPGPRGQAVVLGVADRPFRTGLDAVGAEEAAAQVEPEALVVARDGVGRAGLGAGAAAVRALRLVEHGQAAEAVGQRGRLARRIGDRPVALPEALPNDGEHGRSLGDYRSWPQYERLKLLLHSGKSEICWSRSAIARPVQLWNDGSTIL